MHRAESDGVSRRRARREGKEGRQRHRESETVSEARRLLSDTKQQKRNVLKGHHSQ